MFITKIKELSVRTRAQLISDVFSLTEANYITNGVAFELAKYLYDEVDYLPWTTFINRIKFYIDLYDSEPSYSKMQSYLSDLVTLYFTKLGWYDDADKFEWNDRFFLIFIILLYYSYKIIKIQLCNF